MPANYDRLGVRFIYPENWKLEEEETIEWPRSISVESPVGAFWSLMIHPDGTDPEKIARDTVDVLRGEYEDVSYEPVWEEIASQPTKGYNLEFFFLDLLIQVQVRSLRVGEQTIVIIAQGEDRDFETFQEVFRAMSESLVRSSVA